MTIQPFGEAAVLVVLGARIDDRVNAHVHRLATALDELRRTTQPALGNAVPGYASLFVPFDPLVLDTRAARALLEPLVSATSNGAEDEDADAAGIRIATRYGGADGPDPDDVAAIHGLRPADVVELHASVEYRVHFVGFAPGFAYLGTVPAAIATPRRPTPRERVPAGSVGIAGEQTGIYPFASPGGWQLIGRTDATVWDPLRDPPVLLLPGMRVRFEPIGG